jgi:hypothetical protein
MVPADIGASHPFGCEERARRVANGTAQKAAAELFSRALPERVRSHSAPSR